MRNKFDVPGREGIMLRYARYRRGYHIYDVKYEKVIEERSIKFDEMVKDSKYLGLRNFSECWVIETLINKNFLEENAIDQIQKSPVVRGLNSELIRGKLEIVLIP